VAKTAHAPTPERIKAAEAEACKRRVSECPCRIDGTFMTFAFDERDARRVARGHAGVGVLVAPARSSIWSMLLCLPTAPGLPL